MSKKSSQATLDLISPFLYTGPKAGTNTTGAYEAFALQGIKGGNNTGSYLITGTSGGHGVIYNGPIDHAMTTSGSGSGSWTVMDVPKRFRAKSTSMYGVDNLGEGSVDLVGSYVSEKANKNGDYPRIGFYYSGPVTSTPSSNAFQSFQAKYNGRPADFTYIHSISGGLAVGNCDRLGDGNPAGNAFIYDPGATDPLTGVKGTQTTIQYPGSSKTNTAYGIWSNGNSSWSNGDPTYTIAGGEGLNGVKLGDGRVGQPIGKGTLIDYDSLTGLFSHYKTYSFTEKSLLPTSMQNDAIVTHFEGIWSNGEGLYKLPATISTTDGNINIAALATVRRNLNGSFGNASWSVFDIPGAIISTNDSVFGDANIGAAIYPAAAGTSDYAGLVL
jgi:hypothetical protein